MNVAMGAAHDFPVDLTARGILKILAGLPPNTKILLRKGRKTPPQPFEQLVAQLAETLSIPYEWERPEEGGRSATFYRDIRMMDRADGLIAFFHPNRVMEGGTGHLVEKAIDVNKPVWAFTVDDGGITRVGEMDPPPGSPAEILSAVVAPR